MKKARSRWTKVPGVWTKGIGTFVQVPIPFVHRSIRSGFTLLEVLAATLIFFIVIASVTATRIRALRAMSESALISQAMTLAEMKMTEMEIKYQDAIDKGGIKTAFGKDEGKFEAPYESFTWQAEFKENPLVVSEEQLVKFLTAFGLSEEESQSQFQQSKIILANLNKALKENMGELVVKVKWQFRKTERSFPLVTHLIPKKPKIGITTDTDLGKTYSP